MVQFSSDGLYFCKVTVIMNKCIFCRSTTNSFLREEHLLSESLGGNIVLPPGLVCDVCNQYFGAKVEREALASPIFQFHRALLSMPTKKGKQPRYVGSNVEIQGNKAGLATIHLAPEDLRQLLALNEGQISIEVFEFGALTRLLLKIGIELAVIQGYDVYASEFDAVRTAARKPQSNMTWPLAMGARKLERVLEDEQNEDEGRVRTYFCDCLIGKDTLTSIDYRTENMS